MTVYRGLPGHVVFELLFSDDAQAVTLTQMRLNVNTAISEPGVQNLTLPDSQGRLVKFSLRLPVAPCTGRIPLLIVLAGIKTNESTLERAPAQAANALITYEYDYDKTAWRRLSYVSRARQVMRMTRQMPGQIEILLRWAQTQPWVDVERINVAGGSIGAIYLPMILRHLQAVGLSFRTVSLAYAGAGRATMCYLMLHHHGRVLAALAAALSWLLLRRMEPARYLPHLKGEFLIVSSLDDERIPRRCSKLYEELTPEPKTIIHKRGAHVDTDQPSILDDVFTTILGWLTERGVMNP